jgi:hypothetical protein
MRSSSEEREADTCEEEGHASSCDTKIISSRVARAGAAQDRQINFPAGLQPIRQLYHNRQKDKCDGKLPDCFLKYIAKIRES